MYVCVCVCVPFVVSLSSISDRTVQETLKAPPMAGWTDAVYQSRLPLFARTTASQVGRFVPFLGLDDYVSAGCTL